MILRQAHRRSDGPNTTQPEDVSIMIEKFMRRYGLTTSGETFAFRYKEMQEGKTSTQYPWDYTNVQGTDNKKIIEIIDFGAYIAVEKFEFKMVTNYDQYTAVIEPGKPGYIQPDPDVRVPLEQWGNFGKPDPKSDKVWIWSHELANALAEGRADRAAAEQHYRNLVTPALDRIDAHRATCEGVF